MGNEVNQVVIRLMEGFSISVDGFPVTQSLNKSRKGVALIEYLLLAGGERVSNQRLLTALWPEEKNTNPENALKTLVSRTRAQMSQISEGLGNCIVADRGAYHWSSIEGVFVDVLALQEAFNRLENRHISQEERIELYEQILRLYTGDALQNEDVYQNEWTISCATSLHARFMEAVYDYITILKKAEEYDKAIIVCRQALAVSAFDERLHTEMINALVSSNRQNEAMQQYKTAEQMSFRYLGQPLSPELQEFYKKTIDASNTLDLMLETIADELVNASNEGGAYICDYAVFRDIYNLQAHNVDRMDSTMNLVLLQVGDLSGQITDNLEQDNMIQCLMSILKKCLRKGDLITRYSASVVALLLPMKDPSMCELVIDRIRQEFYRKYSTSKISFKYRMGRLRSTRSNLAAAGKPSAGRAGTQR